MASSPGIWYEALRAPHEVPRPSRKWPVIAIGILSASSLLIGVSWWKQQPLLDQVKEREGILSESSLISFALKSSYPPLATLSLYGYKHVVEPYKNSTFYVREGAAGTSSNFVWTISAQNGDVEAIYHGPEVTHIFKAVAHTYSITLEELSEAGEVLGSVTSSATCKYIRRDTHRMHDEDRERTLSAMRIMFDLDGDEGRALYGPKYYSFNELLVLHLDRATQLRCSPWHGTTVFVVAHQAMMLQVEQSLQAIDPTLSLPWMDLSVEVGLGKDWRSSPMFGPDWFGSFGKAENDYRVTDSIFAGVRIPADCSKPEKNAYCRLTDSYNTDDSEYLTRTDQICGLPSTGRITTCGLLLDVLEQQTYVDVVGQINGNVHSFLHELFGGSWDCPFPINEAMALHPGNAALQLFLEGDVALQVGIIQTRLVGDSLIQCPADCEGLPVSSCRCYCPLMHKLLSEGASVYEASCKIIDEYGYFSETLAAVLDTLPSAEAREALVVWLAGFMCTPGRLTPFSSPLSSPSDPLFAPTHAFFDALLTSVFLRNPDLVVNWENDDTCWGYQWLAHMPFHDFLDEHNQFYTNQELQGFFHPRNPALPYVFDNLDFASCKVDTPI